MTYWLVDGIAERLHLGQRREAVAGWRILTDGKKALLGLAPGDHGGHREL